MISLTNRNKRLLRQIGVFLAIVLVLVVSLSLIPQKWQSAATAFSLILSAIAALFLDITSDELRNRIRYWNEKRVKSDKDEKIEVRLSFNYSLHEPANPGDIGSEIEDSLGVHSVSNVHFTTTRKSKYGRILKEITLDSTMAATGGDDSNPSLFSDGGSVPDAEGGPNHSKITNIRGRLTGETTYTKLQKMITTLFMEERKIHTAFSPYKASTGDSYSIQCTLEEDLDLDIEGMCYLIEPEGFEAWTPEYEIWMESEVIKVEHFGGEEMADVKEYVEKLVTFYG